MASSSPQLFKPEIRSALLRFASVSFVCALPSTELGRAQNGRVPFPSGRLSPTVAEDGEIAHDLPLAYICR